MNKWWKAGLLGAGALGLTALTGGAAAGPLAGLLGGAGEGAAAAGAAGAGEAAAAGTAAATGAEAAGTAAAAAPGATAFVTQPVTGLLGAGDLSGSLAGTDMAYGGTQALAEAPSAAPSMLQQAGEYAKMGGKAASAYGTVQQGMGAGQPQMRPPQAQPIFQGQQAPIAPQGLMAPQGNQFAQMLLMQRQRGMLG